MTVCDVAKVAKKVAEEVAKKVHKMIKNITIFEWHLSHRKNQKTPKRNHRNETTATKPPKHRNKTSETPKKL